MSRPGLGFHHRLWWTLGGLASGPLPTLQQSSCVRQPLPVGPHLRKSPPPPPPPRAAASLGNKLSLSLWV